MGRLDEAAAELVASQHANDLAALRAQLGAETSRANTLATRILDLEDKLAISTAASSVKLDPAPWAKPKTGKAAKGRAIAWLNFSDWHFDEVVRPESINGRNAYNRQIGEMRLRQWVDRVIRIGESLAPAYGWDGAVISINGDIFSGWLHDLRLTNDGDGLFDDVRHWANLIAAALRDVAEYFGHVEAYVTVGNHGRLSVKWSSKAAVSENIEYLMGLTLADWFATDPKVNVHVPNGVDVLFDIYDLRICQSHGNTGSGQTAGGGLAGPWPRIERIYLNKQRDHKDSGGFNVITMGHYHMYRAAAFGRQGYLVNGAGKGFDEYCRDNGYEGQPAAQGFSIVDPEFGLIGHHPVLVSDRKAEGW